MIFTSTVTYSPLTVLPSVKIFSIPQNQGPQNQILALPIYRHSFTKNITHAQPTLTLYNQQDELHYRQRIEQFNGHFFFATNLLIQALKRESCSWKRNIITPKNHIIKLSSSLHLNEATTLAILYTN